MGVETRFQDTWVVSGSVMCGESCLLSVTRHVCFTVDRLVWDVEATHQETAFQ